MKVGAKPGGGGPVGDGDQGKGDVGGDQSAPAVAENDVIVAIHYKEVVEDSPKLKSRYHRVSTENPRPIAFNFNFTPPPHAQSLDRSWRRKCS